ncbi:MAG TPA: VIT domain-containing protein [Chthonomonadaceae bacterium]|nr:VIT domain-containing protein [Chthonomonadaceae bacterium]
MTVHGTALRAAVRALTAAVAVALAATSAGAQGILFPERPVRPPVAGIRPAPLPAQPFYVKNLRVNTVINDAVAETTVEQTFVNTASVQQEGTYLYPLPEGATPSAFTMTVGDRTMEPRILSHEEAHAIYEGYVRRYRDPALLEYVDRSLIKISVFPIPPLGERTIRMRYTEILKPQGEVRRYAYPLSTSRFGSRPVGAATVTIKLMTSSPIKNVYSPTHDLSVRKSDERTAIASWEGTNEVSDRDLTLFYSTSRDDVGLSLLTYKSGDRDGYFMLLAAPRVTIPKDKILAKHVVFVLDRTGSMQGKKIEQARKSLLFCLSNLNARDRFDVITFNESPDVLFPRLVAVNDETVGKARRFVENIEASGGTNIDDALKAATGLFSGDDSRQNMIVFLTDGLPTVGETNTETIIRHFKEVNGDRLADAGARGVKLARAGSARDPGKHIRLFTFGLGYDVNVPFLDKLADVGSGDSEYVKPEEDVEAKVSTFYAKVAAPILADVKVAFDGADVYDVYPKAFPDLFKGSQLVITGRFRGAGRGTVRLSGLSNGSDETFKMETGFGAADGANTFLPRIWATRKLGYLIDQVRLSDNPAGNREVIDEIVRLSKDYGIITEYTSFLVDENEQAALNLRAGALTDATNAPIVRQEVARRARAFGLSGESVTDQSGRAKDLKKTDQSYSRYQSANGSVNYYEAEKSVPVDKMIQFNGDLFSGAKGAPGDKVALGQPARGNFGGAVSGLQAPGGLASSAAGGGFGGLGAGAPPPGRLAAPLGRIYRQTGENGRAAGRQGAGALKEDQLSQNEARNAITLQVVKDRTFYRQANNVWQDHSYDPKKEHLFKIQAFSDAHFALLKAAPDLGAYSSVGDEVIVRIGRNAVEIGKTGKEKLTPAEIKEIVGK